ncbi:hypothetical protein TRFO_37058 [Tritrichomonas foetus]|uniref:Uncharacterized protein n=1 Tax=Tritrichomonas foetus TaxID=1144522 RepID=A0A1J4JEL9_9EUKA|nr:hypothetical protein TRFO_37058 [Tritrichomonas foetus]|eukprot:OHS96743.1 hypothetical protein TRFO_37058 [Tritrichomonas foetus]
MNNHNANELQQFTPKYTFDILFQNSSDSCFDEEELASIFENSELDSSEQTSKSTKENTIDVEVNLSKDIMNEEEEHSEYLKGSYQSKWFIQKTTKRNSYVSPINSSIGKPIGKMTVMMEMIECFPNNNSYQSLKETLQQLLQYHDFSIDEAISFLSNSFLKNNESYDHFVQRVINTIGQIKGSLS